MLFDIFSKRQKRNRGQMADVYQYDSIPHELRVQIVYILRDAQGAKPNHNYQLSRLFEDSCAHVRNVLLREYGVFFLKSQYGTAEIDLFEFLCDQATEAEKVLDIIELFLNRVSSRGYSSLASQMSDELNARFREHGVGFQHESGQIIRIDSQVIHSQVVQPALKILAGRMYKGANNEFLSAHAHYRAGRYKECLSDCLKALESCIKAICDKRGWDYDKNSDTADRLIEIVFQHDLLPDFMQAHFSGLKAALKSGVPTIRNRQSGHGQGTDIVDVPEHVAAYMLHLTAANILLLAKADEQTA